MRFLKWFFGLLLIVIVAVSVSAYVFLKNFDLNKYKSYAENLVYEKTGRKLTIAGDTSLEISLIPTIVINDISFANPDWAKNKQMAEVKAIELRFSLLPLLSKKIVVDRALLKQPKIYLETSKDGKNSWDIEFASAQEAKVSGNGWLIKSANAAESASALDMLSDFVAKQVAIENGKVEYYKHTDKSSMNLAINSITFNTEGMNSPMNVNWDVVFNEMKFNGKGKLGSLGRLMSGQKYPLKLDMKALNVSAVINGEVDDLKTMSKATFDYNIYNPAGNFNAPEATVIGTGTAQTDKVSLNISKLLLANNELVATVTAILAQSRPQVILSLSGKEFKLESLNKNAATALNFALIKTAGASEFVPNDVFPFDLLNMVDATVDINLKKLIVNSDLTLANLYAKADLNNGLLKVQPVSFSIGEGKAQFDITANAKNKSVVIKGSTKDILLTDLHKEFKIDDNDDFGFVSGGATQTKIDLSGNGSTYRQLVNSLNGQVIAIVEKSNLHSGKLKFLTNGFVSQLLSVLKIDTQKAENVDLKCAVVRADFTDGKINFPKGIAVNSDKVDLVSNGTVNLHNDKLNLSVNAYRSGVVDVSIVQTLLNLVKVGGTMQSPKITIDQTGALKTIAGVAVSGGAFAGAQLLLDKDTAPCYTALKDTEFKNKFEAPSTISKATQGTYQGASQAVDEGVELVKSSAKEIKNTAKGLLKNILK